MQNLPIINEEQNQVKLPNLNEYSNIVRSRSNENYDIKSMKSSFSSSTSSIFDDLNISTRDLAKYSLKNHHTSTEKASSLPNLNARSLALLDQSQNFQFTYDTTRIAIKNSIESATQTDNVNNKSDYQFTKDSGIEVNHTNYPSDSSAQSSIIDSSDLVMLNTIREESSPDFISKLEMHNGITIQDKSKLCLEESSLNERKIDDTDSFESVSSLANHDRSSPIINNSDFEVKQKNLKHYEILFNEIALAYNLNQNRLKESICIYQEKYRKADYMTNLLFDNLTSTLNVSYLDQFVSIKS
jgi:hypothetical protein